MDATRTAGAMGQTRSLKNTTEPTLPESKVRGGASIDAGTLASSSPSSPQLNPPRNSGQDAPRE
eukprot:8892805-Pyramimonas_sp.AAC.1